MLKKIDINAFEGKETPFYYYDLDLLQTTVDRLKKESEKYDYTVHYALKANTDDRVLQIISEAGFGADCVSGNEVKKALEHNFSPEDIYYAGVGKTDTEIRAALIGNIGCFNCESKQEIGVISQIASKMGVIAKIALRINPHINSKSHAYITTGIEENKFGIQLWELDEVLSAVSTLENVELIGLHFHIGSQIADLSVFKELCLKVNEVNEYIGGKGFNLSILNLGGGLGIDYVNPELNSIPDFGKFFETIHQTLKVKPLQHVHFELGRSVVAHMGTLIAKVLFIKNGRSKSFAVVDAGMTELIRPALYNSVHKIDNLTQNEIGVAGTKDDNLYDIVGPVCETTDFLGRDISLPSTFRGDLLAVWSVGAYGQSMASNYNLRERAGVVYSDELLIDTGQEEVSKQRIQANT
ncbi:MAG: diaminopimelate decarboxylase [Bacteroidales bacterium]|nr:diaminopimelate decarboxylase [Bacteroidales bacterium]